MKKNQSHFPLQWIVFSALVLLCPLLLQTDGFIQNLGLDGFGGNAWVRILASALLYVMLAIGLNVVVGYAGLLDLGYVAFYAVGAYVFALLASSHLLEVFPWFNAMFPNGLNLPWYLLLILAVALASLLGMLLGLPVLKLRGDYLAIVTLGFGEIIRIFMNNLDRPINITNGPKGLAGIDPITIFGVDLSKPLQVGAFEVASVSLYYYLFLVFVVLSYFISLRLEKSRLGRAWMAIREDQMAAQAMGINTRNVKLLAFAIGAGFGGVSGVMFASFQGFVSPESFTLMESIMIVAMVVLGGIGYLPGVVLGAIFLAALPEVLRYVVDFFSLQRVTDGRIDGPILRQLLIASAMIGIMMMRPKGIWPAPEHGKSLQVRNQGGKE